MPLLGLIGNPENRRIRDCARIAPEYGWTPRVFSWLELLDRGFGGLRECDAVRIDSPGEHAELARRLIALGGGPDEPLQHGEIGHLKAYHQGFLRVLDPLGACGARFINAPRHIATMFDKWACHRLFAEAGLDRPDSFLAGTSVDEIRRGTTGRLFLKPLHGSSASGVCAFRWSGDREQLIAPIEIEYGEQGVRFFNSLRVRSYRDPREIRLILKHLLSEGMIAEHWLPKAKLDGQNFDLRIVVIGGEAQHLVVRKSRHPMTNLHLGNARGDLAEVEREFDLSGCRGLAEQAMACFPGHLYAGVDILLTPRGRPVLLEINAFGDLLPGIEFEGRSTYAAILEAAGHVRCHSI